MLRKTTYLILLAAIISCERIANVSPERIGISAGTEEMSVISRASAVPYSNKDTLKSAVWFSTSSTQFPHNPQSPTNLPCRTEMKFIGSAITYADFTPKDSSTPLILTYPTGENTPVYCVGFYPTTGWECSDNVNVRHAINGNEDLMFADVIDGTWNHHFQSQNYKHILTWIKVNVCAMTMETARQWGKVTNITIKTRNSLKIDLSKNREKVSYDGDYQQLTVYNNQDGIDLNLTSRDMGTVFCSPETEYLITITTTKYGEKSLTVKLTDLNYEELTDANEATGKLFIISLYFNPFSIVEGTCTLNYWNDQNEDLYMKPPQENN